MSKANVIALVGLSGVGKSSVLANLAGQVRFLHLRASDLIKSEKAIGSVSAPSSDELRLGTVLDNQNLPIRAFQRTTFGVDVPIVLDGHILVDSEHEIIEIPVSVFRAIGATHIVFLQDTPEEIVRRRRLDANRFRPVRSADELLDQQSRAIVLAARSACGMNIPISIIMQGHLRTLSDLIGK